MKSVNKGILVVLLAIIIGICLPLNVYAADSVKVTVGSTEVNLNGETEVTITLSGNSQDIQGVELWVTYDPTILEPTSGDYSGGGGKIRILSTEKTSFTIKFKAIAAGTSKVDIDTSQSTIGYFEGTEIAKMDVQVSAGTVTVKGAATQSKNNNLASLVVSPGTFTPAFSKDVTTYNMTLDEYCARLTVSATAEDSKATISVWGAAMDPGDNTTKITVTAENGEQKVYTIYTKVPEKKQEETQKADEELIIEVDGRLYRVLNNFDEGLMPEGYEAADYTYKKNKVVVGKGLSNGKIIFCVSSADIERDEPQFVVYDEQTGSFSYLRIITTSGASYTVIEDEMVMSAVTVPEGFVESEYSFNNITYKVWVDSKNTVAEYFIIYCTNFNGETGWYQYDMMEGTMQRAFLNGFTAGEEETVPVESETQSQASNENTEEMTELKKEYDDYVKKSKLALSLMSFLLVAIVIVVIVFAVKSFRDPYDDDDDEDESYREAVSNVEKREKSKAEKPVKKSAKKKDIDEYDSEEDEYDEEDEYEQYEENDNESDDDSDDINFLS